MLNSITRATFAVSAAAAVWFYIAAPLIAKFTSGVATITAVL